MEYKNKTIVELRPTKEQLWAALASCVRLLDPEDPEAKE